VSSSSDIATVYKSGTTYASTVSNSLKATLALWKLTEGETYSLILTATDSDGSSSYSTLSVVINEPPSSGDIAVTPKDGYALESSFRFTAEEWDDTDKPFTYIFGTTGINSDGTIDASVLSPFGDERHQSFFAGVILEAGLNSTNYSVNMLNINTCGDYTPFLLFVHSPIYYFVSEFTYAN